MRHPVPGNQIEQTPPLEPIRCLQSHITHNQCLVVGFLFDPASRMLSQQKLSNLVVDKYRNSERQRRQPPHPPGNAATTVIVGVGFCDFYISYLFEFRNYTQFGADSLQL